MRLNELITDKLNGLVPDDLLRKIETTVNEYENQKSASAENNGKKRCMLMAKASVTTWLAAGEHAELLSMAQGVLADPNSVEWYIDDYERVTLHLALTDDAAGAENILF
jgi:hypothetical protein